MNENIQPAPRTPEKEWTTDNILQKQKTEGC